MKFKNIFISGESAFDLSDKSNRFYFVIIALLIFFAYLPTLQYDYVYADQWRTFKHSLFDEPALTKLSKSFYSKIYFDLGSGRPFGSIGEIIEHTCVSKISDFSKLRPIVLVIAMFSAFCVGLALSPSCGGIVNGTAIGALFVLSPGYANVYYNGFESVMKIIALILATLSYIFFSRAISEKFQKKKLLISSILFLTACLIYPPWAYIVFILSLIDFLFCAQCERNTKIKNLFIKTLFFLAVSVLYYIVIKIIIMLLRAEAADIGVYAFSANLDILYLIKRFFTVIVYYLSQPPLNTLYASIRIMNIVFLLLVVVFYTTYFIYNHEKKFINAVILLLITYSICLFLIFISLAPWLVSSMPIPPNRVSVPLSLFMCTLTGYVLFRVSARLFPARKHLSTILIIFIILLPASAIQNKRTAIEVGISGTQIEVMRMAVHKWINEYSFTKKRLIVVVMPKKQRPSFYERVLNNVYPYEYSKDNFISQILPEIFVKNPDPLMGFTLLSDFIKEIRDKNRIREGLIGDMNIAGYGDSLEFGFNKLYYVKMFNALIREDCDSHHPLSLMTIYYLLPEQAEAVLDAGKFNIVFTVINQGEQVKTKHEILEINLSLITNLPEPLIVNPNILLSK